MRIAAEGSKFGIPAAKLGLGYAYDGIKKLIDLVGPAYAREIFLHRAPVHRRGGAAMGLVNRVVPDGELEATSTILRDTIAANAPLTVRSAKLIVREALKDDAERDLAAVDRAVAECFASADYMEGQTAFMEKRKPNFIGA